MDKRLSAAIIASVLLLPTTTFAQESLTTPLAACAKISSSLERLDCFDTLAKKSVASSKEGLAATSQPSTGSPSDRGQSSKDRWSIMQEKDQLTDQSIVIGRTEADSGPNHQGRYPFLIFRCTGSSLEAYVAWRQYIGSEYAMVTFRLDGDTAKQQQWKVSTDGTASFTSDPALFFLQLSTTKKLTVSVMPPSSSPIVSTFDLSGIVRVEEAFQGACKLK